VILSSGLRRPNSGTTLSGLSARHDGHILFSPDGIRNVADGIEFVAVTSVPVAQSSFRFALGVEGLNF